MENSTKALLIAASVLIVIVLISISIKILNSASGVTDEVESVSKTLAASTFNSQFLSYVSKSTSGAQVKSFLSKVIAHNAAVSSSAEFSIDKHQIYINFKDKNGNHLQPNPNITVDGHNWTTLQLQSIYSCISDTSKYDIHVTPSCGITGTNGGYYKGYIICMTIKETT